MVRVLLDTCVVSELQRTQPNPLVVDRISAIHTASHFLSVITLGEIFKGIALLEPSARKNKLNAWYLELEQTYRQQVLLVDADVARIWGEISANAQKQGIIIPTSDGLIAATALRHGLHVMTRNSKHFEATGAMVIDPWES
jgi:predicted nucleic acid-binding protein